MNRIGVQTKNIVYDSELGRGSEMRRTSGSDPQAGFAMLKKAGFSCVDFSLNSYLLNTVLYQSERNHFFDKSEAELDEFFRPHRSGAAAAGVTVHQMHMPYPNYVPNGTKELNDYLWNVVAPKSMHVCAFFECPYIVVHGFKLARNLGSEEAEWEQTERFLDTLAPMARELGITVCIENLYNGVGGHIVEGPCCHAKKAAERIDRFNERHRGEVLGFCFDTGHANLVGIDFEGFIAELGHRLKVLHIHDNDGVADLHQIPFTFTKTRENKVSTDWEGFVRGLRRIRFDGVLSFETGPVLTAFPEELKEAALGMIARIGGYFAGMIAEKER